LTVKKIVLEQISTFDRQKDCVGANFHF